MISPSIRPTRPCCVVLRRRQAVAAALAAACLLCGTTQVVRAQEGADISPEFILRRREARLEKYSPVRTQFNEKDLGWLVSNGEMGGLASLDGCWIPSLFLADLWSSPTSRFEMNSPRLAPKDVGVKELVARGAKYRQSLDLRDGVLVTRCGAGEPGGFQTRMFFSMAERRLMVIEGRNLAKTGAEEWTIEVPTLNFAVRDGEIVAAVSADKPFTRRAWAARASVPLKKLGRGRYAATVRPGESLVLLFAATTNFDGADFAEQARRIVAAAGDVETLLAASRRAWQRRVCADGRRRVGRRKVRSPVLSLFVLHLVPDRQRPLPAGGVAVCQRLLGHAPVRLRHGGLSHDGADGVGGVRRGPPHVAHLLQARGDAAQRRLLLPHGARRGGQGAARPGRHGLRARVPDRRREPARGRLRLAPQPPRLRRGDVLPVSSLRPRRETPAGGSLPGAAGDGRVLADILPLG